MRHRVIPCASRRCNNSAWRRCFGRKSAYRRPVRVEEKMIRAVVWSSPRSAIRQSRRTTLLPSLPVSMHTCAQYAPQLSVHRTRTWCWRQTHSAPYAFNIAPVSSTSGERTNLKTTRYSYRRALATSASASAVDIAVPGTAMDNDAPDLKRWEELHWQQDPVKTHLSGEAAYTQQTKFEMEVHQKRMMEVAQTLRQLMADTDTPVKQDGSVAKATKNIILMWWKPLAALIHEEQEKLHRAMTGDDRKKFTPYLMQVKADELAMLTVMEFLNLVLVNADGVRVVKAAQKIGRAVEAAVVMNRLKSLTRQQDRAKRRQEETERKEVLERAQLQAKIEAEDAKLLSIDDIFEDTVFQDQRDRIDDLELGDDDSIMTSDDDGKRGQGGHMYRSVYKRLADQLNSKSHSPPSEEVSRKAREALQMHCQKELLAGFDERDWDLASAVKVGSALLVRLLKTAKVWDDVLRPGWSEHYDEASGKTCYSLTSKEDSSGAQYPEVLATWWECEDEGGKTYYYDPVNDEKTDKNPAKQRKKVDAFEHFYVTMHARRYGMLRCHDKVFDELIKSGGHALDQNGHDPKYLPMVCEPRPWVTHDEGGMLHLPMKVMRARGEMEQTESLRRADPIPGVYDGLNALGRVPWTIHTRVLDVAEYLFQNESRGQGIAGLPTLDDTAAPPLPSGGDPEDEAYKQEVRAARRLIEKVKQTNRELYSLRMDTKLKLGVAQAMKDFQRIYFPYSIDFRGRSYPVPPHLNHLGSDMCRALLIFSEKKPLGPEGLRWLKIHLANLYGNDKLSFDGRADWIDEMMDEVLDSAAQPLSGRRWWLGAENPFQALSVCDEIRKAIDSGDPASYMSCVPVHMDGSCNGLQHYAALGRDYGGGQAVNLIPSDKPQDVYTKVMHMVIDQLERDANDGDEEEKEMANLLQGHVTRKVVKQTVMTSVYGVTFVGARKQIHARLEDRFLTPGVPASDELDRQLYRMAKYLAGVTLDQMNNLFKEARVIMAWLANCADKVSQAGVTSAAQMGVTQAGHPMSWVTPLGLPVVQPYRAPGKQQLKTELQHIVIARYHEDLKVNRVRQRAAFPPNYVHSLDASHMLMTAIEMDRRGLQFAAVHDSYWTHAGTVNDMNEVLRDQFVELYKKPLLEDLHLGLRMRFPDLDFEPIPERGTLDIEKVKQSWYFFD